MELESPGLEGEQPLSAVANLGHVCHARLLVPLNALKGSPSPAYMQPGNKRWINERRTNGNQFTHSFHLCLGNIPNGVKEHTCLKHFTVFPLSLSLCPEMAEGSPSRRYFLYTVSWSSCGILNFES